MFCYETGRRTHRYPDCQLSSIVITSIDYHCKLVGLVSRLITRIASAAHEQLHCWTASSLIRKIVGLHDTRLLPIEGYRSPDRSVRR